MKHNKKETIYQESDKDTFVTDESSKGEELT